MAENRTNRELQTREKTERRRSWKRADILPNPTPEPGWDFHWVRISTRGEADPTNVSTMLREGWEPVKASDHPEIPVLELDQGRFKDSIVIGGLMLCKTPSEMAADRNGYFADQATAQIRSVDNNFMRENDPRMPLFHERKSNVTFGRSS